MPQRTAIPNPQDIFRRQLPNGITFLARHNPHSASFVLAGYMPTGSLCDPPGREGLAEMTASLLMTGTQQHDEAQLYERLESAAAHLGYNNSTEFTAFSGQALTEDYDLLLETLAETLCAPAFPQKHLERIRVEWLAYLRERRYAAGEMAGLHLRQALYGTHPYRRDGNGTFESIQAIRRQEARAFHERWYAPQGCVIAVAGGIPPREAYARLTRALEGWQNPKYRPRPQAPASVPLPADTAPRYLSIPDARQAVIAVGGVIVPATHPDYLPLVVARDILAGFGLQGRLGRRLREERALVYSVSSGLNNMRGPGMWSFTCATAPENAVQALEALHAELARFRQAPVSAEELQDSISSILGAEAFRFADNGGVASSLLELARFAYPLDYYTRLPDLVRAVSAEDVLRVAQTYLAPQRLVSVVARPAEAQGA